MKIQTIFIILFLTLSCKEANHNGKKIIDTDRFEIEVPIDWEYIKESGIDSFVGKIIGQDVELSFDWSEMGYANSLIPNEEEYISDFEWDWMPKNEPYIKRGIIYTSGNPDDERQRLMKEKGINDSTLIKVEKMQIPKVKILKEKTDYSAILTYKDTVVTIDIQLPEETKNHLIQIDTINNYKRKIIIPKTGIDGVTGIYFKDLNSDFNFNLTGRNLSFDNQQKAIESFKSIKIKRN